MAKDHGSSVKDGRLYEKLRKQGESKDKAARVANARAGGTNVSKKGGKGEATTTAPRRNSSSVPRRSGSRAARA